MDLKSEIPLIDGHTHCFSREVLSLLAKVMDQCRLDAFNVCAIVCRGGSSLCQNHLALLAKLTYPGRVYACGGLFHGPAAMAGDGLDLPGQAKRLMELGFDGIKMLEGKPSTYKQLGLAMNDPAYDAYYDYLQAGGIPVVWHVADPESFWDRDKIPPHFLKQGWFYGDGTYPSQEQLYAEVDDVLGRFPGLRITFAHFYFLSADIERARRFLDRWPNVSFDITPGTEMYANFSAKPEQWRRFFTDYQDRIVFGTDNFCSVQGDEVSEGADNILVMRRFLETGEAFTGYGYRLRGLHLGREVLAKIYSGNFRRRFGESPKRVNKADVLASARRLLATAEQAETDQAALAGLKAVIAELQGASD